MSIPYLTIELIIDTIALFLGMILILRKSDNLPKFYWGIIASCISLAFIWENIGWVMMRTENPTYEYTDILNIEKMIKFYLLASVVSLYPLASMRPGYLTSFRVTLFLIPPIVISTIGICYLCFNGYITLLESITQIGKDLNKFDVQLRLSIFFFTIVLPLAYFICPLLVDNKQRKVNQMMYIFIGFIFSLLIMYILFTLFVCGLFFNGFGFISILFSIFFSVQYLRSESPLSDRRVTKEEDPVFVTDTENKKEESVPTSIISPLFLELDEFLKEGHAYTNDQFAIEHLVKHFRKSELELSSAIKNAGYSGFKEYINNLRLEYFRQVILEDSHRTTKELWVLCGFTSKSTFYRQFSTRYNETPREFIDKHIIK